MTKKTMVVVDGEEDILELVRYNLSREGFTINSQAFISGQHGIIS